MLPIAGFTTEPHYDGNDGTYTLGILPAATTYTWKQVPAVSAGSEFEDDGDRHFILTTVDMSNLGTVTGSTYLTIDGDSKIGNVFGGGEESKVEDNTSVILSGNTEVVGNVFGGGNEGSVGGNSQVRLCDGCSF